VGVRRRIRAAPEFLGKTEYVVNYFLLVAEEARELMAKLGVRKFNELIGRADCSTPRRDRALERRRALDFSRSFTGPTCPPRSRAITPKARTTPWRRRSTTG